MLTHKTKPQTQNTDLFLENRKNELLAYIYAKDHQNALKILNDICSRFAHANTFDSAPPSFSENDEKILNQIILISKAFASQMQEQDRAQCLHLQKQIKQKQLSPVSGDHQINLLLKEYLNIILKITQRKLYSLIKKLKIIDRIICMRIMVMLLFIYSQEMLSAIWVLV